jgi:hypothetical protein
MVLNTSMDHKGNHPHTLKEITNGMDILDLVDIRRLKYPDLVTLHGGGSTKLVVLITFFMSFSLVPKVKKVLIGDIMRSDHHIIGIYISLT